MIIWVIDTRVCTNLSSKNSYLPVQFIVNRWLNAGIGSIFGLSFGLITLVDCVRHYREKKRCDLREFYLREDPYYFRIEVALFFVFGPLNITLTSFNASILIEKGDQVQQVGSIVLDLLPNLILAAIINLFPLSVTIFKLVKGCFNKKNVDHDGVVEVLSNPDLFEPFKKFSETEWSVENVLIYNDIIQYEKSPSKELGMKIIKNYLEKGAPLEVNVTRKEAEEIIKIFQQSKENEESFESLKKTIILNLSDTYSRFIFSDEYITWEVKSKIKNNL